MKCGARVALGVAGGYFLGRTKKMKLAMMLASMAAGRRASAPGGLLSEGTKLLSQSPEIVRLNEELRGRLVEAGKNAALAVATRQVEALTDRIGQRVTSLGDAAAEPARKAGGPVKKAGKRFTERASDEDESAEYAGEDEGDQYESEEYAEPEDEPAVSEEEVPEEEVSEEEEEAPAPRAGGTGAGTGVLRRPAAAAGNVTRAAGKVAPARGAGQGAPRGGGQGAPRGGGGQGAPRGGGGQGAPRGGGQQPPPRGSDQPARVRRSDGDD